MNADRIPALCQGCGRQGPMPFGVAKRPRWCRCAKVGGPYVAPPGHVSAFVCESHEASAFRERCRLAGNAEREARDALAGRWIRCGRGWRELPRGNAKRERLERAYAAALRALRALQRACPHEHRSIFDRRSCGCCYATLDVDVEIGREFHAIDQEVARQRRRARRAA